jgi:Holliday junction resolvase RusA-like endonuclease
MYKIARGNRRLVKDPAVAAYQAMVTLIVRTQRPRGFPGPGQIRVRYWFELSRDIDCDNALKALNDAIALALDVDDRRFLPMVVCKHVGSKHPRVTIEIGGELEPCTCQLSTEADRRPS